MKTIEEVIFELRERIDDADANQMRAVFGTPREQWLARRGALTELLHWILEK